MRMPALADPVGQPGRDRGTHRGRRGQYQSELPLGARGPPLQPSLL
jgi:hypothetical protein